MKKYNDTVIPNNYSVCQLVDCPMAATCLHQIAYAPLIEDEDSKYLSLIKPALCKENESCVFYRNAAPVTFARGFTNFQKKMLPGQYQGFKAKLMSHYGRNPYFDRRSGNLRLDLKEQQLILQVLKGEGVTQEVKFDAYETDINW